jgi:Protein of unknown function (DUF1579)
MTDTRYLSFAVAMLLTCMVGAQTPGNTADPTKTAYGERNVSAPKELDVFAFLIGTWEGKAKAKLADGKVAEVPFTWIGRYILNGTAIADEAHSIAPDGKPVLGITLRQYDADGKTWVVEFLNVSYSFVRKQVNSRAGSVTVRGRTVTVVSESPGWAGREHYEVMDRDHWRYRLDTSSDEGKNWNEGQLEIAFQRAK